LITERVASFPLFAWPLQRAIISNIDAENDYIKQVVKTEPFRSNQTNLIHTDDYILARPELKRLKDDIHQLVEKYAFETLAYKNVTCELEQSWINVSKPGQFHNVHYHPNVIISGTYYPFGSTGAPIAFMNPNRFQLQPDTNNSNNPMSMISRPVVYIDCGPGELLLWLAPLSHAVHSNGSDDKRISLAFNYMIRGSMGQHQSLDRLDL
jgi:uncharacterized protein (TIGR02466 family)